MKIMRTQMKGKTVELGEPEAQSADAQMIDLRSRRRASLDEGAGQ